MKKNCQELEIKCNENNTLLAFNLSNVQHRMECLYACAMENHWMLKTSCIVNEPQWSVNV